MEKLNICIISKYPPHRGGTAAVNYWVARALGEMGHRVHVITDLVGESNNYFRKLDKTLLDGLEPKNVKVYGGRSERLPLSNSRTSILSNLALEVIRETDIDLIYSKYFIPYGVAGFLAKLATGKPLVLKHGGSDITYMYRDPFYKTLILEMLRRSDRVILNRSKIEEVVGAGVDKRKISTLFDFTMPHSEISAHENRKWLDKLGIGRDVPLLGCFGRVIFARGFPEMLKALSRIKEEDFLLLMAPSEGKEQITPLISKFGLEKKVLLLDYQPPWRMPYLYNSLTALISTELDFPVKIHTPLTAYEALYFGKCTVISEETHQKTPYNGLKNGEEIIVVDPRNTEDYAARLKWIIQNPEEAERVGKKGKSVLQLDGKCQIEKLVKIFRSTLENQGVN